jgi:hypothetical protein
VPGQVLDPSASSTIPAQLGDGRLPLRWNSQLLPVLLPRLVLAASELLTLDLALTSASPSAAPSNALGVAQVLLAWVPGSGVFSVAVQVPSGSTSPSAGPSDISSVSPSAGPNAVL